MYVEGRVALILKGVKVKMGQSLIGLILIRLVAGLMARCNSDFI